MQSKARDVESYLLEVPDVWHPILVELRMICKEVLVCFEESMQYGMPSYNRMEGEVEIAFARQKQYLSFYVLKKDVLDQYRALLEGIDVGKGCIRYRRVEQIDFALIRRILVDNYKSLAPIC